jgi:hypothetical protein
MGVTKMAAGFAVGYVLGTRAGRDTYERIVDGTRTLTNQPAAQPMLATGHDAATTMAKTAAAKADDMTNVDAETGAGTAQASRKGGGNQATTSADTTVPTAASGDRPTHGGQAE